RHGLDAADARGVGEAGGTLRPEGQVGGKRGGSEPVGGVGGEGGRDWGRTGGPGGVRARLVGVGETARRSSGRASDEERRVARRNLELLGEHGFLGLTVPEEYGGLGENHVAYAMTCETIARYGCASTAMCYVMHIGAVSAIMYRPTPELVDKYIRPLASGKI